MKLRHCKYTASTGGCSVLNHPEMNQLDCMWNSGFYSNQTQAFLSTLILLSHGIIPDKISYAMGFKRLKKDPDRDIFPDFYKIDPRVSVQLLKTVTLPDENRKQFDKNFQKKSVSIGAKDWKSCRSRKTLQNEYLVAKFCFDTAENEPCKV